MRTRIVSLLVLASAGFVALSLIRGQERPPVFTPTPRPIPAPSPQPAHETTVPAAAPISAPRDFSKYTGLQQQMLYGAQRGADWLARMNTDKGRFRHGWLPALKTEMDGDHYLRQAGAAFALARAARFLGEDRYTARATQAVTLLLDETAVDPKSPQVRHTVLPSPVLNRLGTAGMLVLAINELPDPQADLLEMSEQLCNYIHNQARPDGSLALADGAEEAKAGAEESDGINLYPGTALYGLMRSYKRRPAAWKLDVVRKAAAYYGPWWRAHKNMAFVPLQTEAYTEAYLLTKEQAFADRVFEMNDWICGFQYDLLDPHTPSWSGGFKSWADGRPVETAPRIDSAAYAEGLADACRAAREVGDLDRYKRYTESLRLCLQFLTLLQYTDANTTHFADWYRENLVGGFHPSYQDGDLRIDYTQHAVAALVQYLEQAAR